MTLKSPGKKATVIDILNKLEEGEKEAMGISSKGDGAASCVHFRKKHHELVKKVKECVRVRFGDLHQDNSLAPLALLDLY